MGQILASTLLLVCIVGLAGCGSKESAQPPGTTSRDDGAVAGGGGVAAACALMVTYKGHDYLATGVEVAPEEGPLLQGATAPPCNDTGEISDPQALEPVTIAELDGVSPSVAVLLQGRNDVVLLRDDVDQEALPEGVARLLHSPQCDPNDEPITLAGPWLGIQTPDETTEDDLVPPYNVMISVDQSSAARYERASLTIRVPASLGSPLTHEDLRSSLWEGGTISVAVGCDEGHYVATQVEAHPPA